jgi:hypothetical protein
MPLDAQLYLKHVLWANSLTWIRILLIPVIEHTGIRKGRDRKADVVLIITYSWSTTINSL